MTTDNQIDLGTLKCVGAASCVGGLALHPLLADYPLLCWSAVDDVHPGKVMTSVAKATVEAIALDTATTPSYEALAAKHGTTPEHVRQAIEYAIQAGFLGE